MSSIVTKISLYFLPLIFDLIISACKELAKRTDNTIDDSVVETLETNKNIVIDAVRVLK